MLIANGVDIAAGTALEDQVHSWDEHGLQFTGKKSEKNNRPRSIKPNLMVFHWSGGEGSYERIFKTLTKRKLGIHLYIDYDGDIYQYADLWTVACAHAHRANARSIGCEMQNLGLGDSTKKFPRGKILMEGHGRHYNGLSMTSAQLESMHALTELVTKSLGIPFKVPTAPDGHGPLLDYLTPKQQQTFAGVAGHIHFSEKVCPGAQVLQSLWQEQDFE